MQWTMAAPCVASQVSLVGKGGKKKKEVPKALWGVLSACWLVIRSLAAYNYVKLHRCWVLSLVLCGPPQGQRTYFSLGLFLVSQASQAQRFGKLHVALYLCSEKKLNLLKQFEVFVVCFVVQPYWP